MRPWLLLVPLALAAAGCRDSRCGDQNANVEGEWSLVAEGTRPTCVGSAPGEVASEVRVRGRVTLAIGQSGGSNTSPEGLTLRRAIGLDAGTFAFTGSVEGSCIEFTTHETGDGPDSELRLSFEGIIRGRRIEGDFTELSSTTCQATGTFKVDITPYAGDVPSGRGRVLENPDGSVRYFFVDAGCVLPPDAGSDGGVDADAGPGDAGEADAGYGCRRERQSVVEYVYPCTRDDDCARGVCAGGVCVAGCESGTDCDVGDACVDLRCEPAPGCGCGAGSTALGWLAVILAWRLSRRRPRD